MPIGHRSHKQDSSIPILLSKVQVWTRRKVGIPRSQRRKRKLKSFKHLISSIKNQFIFQKWIYKHQFFLLPFFVSILTSRQQQEILSEINFVHCLLDMEIGFIFSACFTFCLFFFNGFSQGFSNKFWQWILIDMLMLLWLPSSFQFIEIIDCVPFYSIGVSEIK